MKNLLMILIIVTAFGCSAPQRSFLYATFLNKNVYKTKAPLAIKKAYFNDIPSTDTREFTLLPNGPIPVITQTSTSVKTSPPSPGTTTSSTTTTTVVSTIPPSTTTTTVSTVVSTTPVTVETTTFNLSQTIPAGYTTDDFIRYKVVRESGDYKYIRILPGCRFNPTINTDIEFVPPATGDITPEEYIFEVSNKSLNPNTNYLASSALIGKIISIPLKVRKEYFKDGNKILEGSLSLGYGFGWKYKLGNHPYHTHYFSTILYAAGINQQKYFALAGKYADGKDSLSAKTDQVSLTYLSFGLAYEYDKFNVGFFAGKDMMFGTLKDWAYQNKWWWGIGIGYELFK